MPPAIPSSVPAVRFRPANAAAVRSDGDFVLYWMVAHRRVRANFALDRAVDWARALGLPLLVLEALRCDYLWASDRLHSFILAGMADNSAACAAGSVGYYPYVEPAVGHGAGLVAALAERAAVIVTDDFPSFFLPRMLAACAPRLPVLLEAVDSNGLLPLRATERVFTTAHSFRRFLHGALPAHLEETPAADGLKRARDLPRRVEVPAAIARRWPAADPALLSPPHVGLDALPIDHDVGPGARVGGPVAAGRALDGFLKERLGRYGVGRNHPDDDAASGLSPYLHFGHIAAHEVFARIRQAEGWSLERLAAKPTGSRAGWWGMGVPAESFLDELVTWRELGYNMASKRSDYTEYASLPLWARTTLADHADDPRPVCYDLATLDRAATHDEIWNAAQRQLVRDGVIHNYLRMLWGKKIFEWSPTPEVAAQIMIELNNRYATDGRNPNSYSGIFWVLGRYDRAWGPERPIYGKIRYMSSDNTARKLRLKQYLSRYGG